MKGWLAGLVAVGLLGALAWWWQAGGNTPSPEQPVSKKAELVRSGKKAAANSPTTARASAAARSTGQKRPPETEGEQVPEVGMAFQGRIDGVTEPVELALLPTSAEVGRGQIVETQADGSFQIDHAPVGDHTLRLQNEGQSLLLDGSLHLPAEGAASAQAWTVPERTGQLQLTFSGVFVQKQVALGLWRTPVAQADWARAAVQQDLALESEQLLSGLPLGTFRLGLLHRHPGHVFVFEPQEVTLTAAEVVSVELRVERVTELRVTNLDQRDFMAVMITKENGGNRLRFNKVTVLDPLDWGDTRALLVFNEREALARQLPPGRYMLEVVASDNAYYAQPVEVALGSVSSYQVSFP